ncbi:hypothetical protein [Candidatus Amarolinea dominans]|uniref:hypothetical protein n=1 Tax=Candidatus Amarolinea dominans TaxID=3140696 RepID=UPI001E10118C|nr:hypothetical protein [Anaerolineae bacterium]
MTTTTPIIVLDLRTVQDHFPGIGRYTFHLAQALVEAAPTWRFTLLTQAQGANTRFDVTGLARRPNVTLHAVSQAIFSPQEQITLPRDLPPGDLVHFPTTSSPISAGAGRSSRSTTSSPTCTRPTCPPRFTASSLRSPPAWPWPARRTS